MAKPADPLKAIELALAATNSSRPNIILVKKMISFAVEQSIESGGKLSPRTILLGVQKNLLGGGSWVERIDSDKTREELLAELKIEVAAILKSEIKIKNEYSVLLAFAFLADWNENGQPQRFSQKDINNCLEGYGRKIIQIGCVFHDYYKDSDDVDRLVTEPGQVESHRKYALTEKGMARVREVINEIAVVLPDHGMPEFLSKRVNKASSGKTP